MKSITSRLLLFISIFFLTITACKKEQVGSDQTLEPEQGPDIPFYALTDDNKLLAFNAKNPGELIATIPISGMLSGEKILSIDFRPANGQLYALSSTSVLYLVDHTTGKLSIVSTVQLNPKIQGSKVDIDFNPTVDRLRLVSSSGQNLRIHPETGVVVMADGEINGAEAGIAGVAYTNNFAGSTETTLFDIDAKSNKLFKQTPPNDGTLVEVGELGVDIDETTSFDISERENLGLASFVVNGENGLYGVNLETGKATPYGKLNSGVSIISIATNPRPVGYTVDDENNLNIVNLANPALPVIDKAITGLVDGEKIVGIDFRPATGQLYGLSDGGKIYTFNLGTAAATRVGTTDIALTGDKFGFDFNPTVDRIRIVSNDGMNIRVHPGTGEIAAVDAKLNPGTPKVTAAAYDMNLPTATSTTLFVIDPTAGKLYKQTPPNDGVLVEIGSLGVSVEDAAGYDIGPISGSGYAVLTTGGGSALYSIDASTGAASKVADLTKKVHGLAVGLGF